METCPAEVDSAPVLAWPWSQISPPTKLLHNPHLILVHPSHIKSGYSIEENFLREFAGVFDSCRFGRFAKLSTYSFAIGDSAEESARSAQNILLQIVATEPLHFVLFVWPVRTWSSVQLALSYCPLNINLILIPQEMLLITRRRMTRLIGLATGALATLAGDGRGPVELPECSKDYCLACFMPSSDGKWLGCATCDTRGSVLYTKLAPYTLLLDSLCDWALSCHGASSFRSSSYRVLCLITPCDVSLVTKDCLSAKPSTHLQWNVHGAAVMPPVDELVQILDDLSFLATACEFPAKSISCVNLGAHADYSQSSTWRLPLFMRAAALLAHYAKGMLAS